MALLCFAKCQCRDGGTSGLLFEAKFGAGQNCDGSTQSASVAPFESQLIAQLRKLTGRSSLRASAKTDQNKRLVRVQQNRKGIRRQTSG